MNCECGCNQPIPNAWRHRPPYFLVGHIERIPCGCACGGVIEWPHDKRTARPRALPGHVTQRRRAAYVAQRLALEPPNPSGLCLCGCGGRTPIATVTSVRQRTVRGEPVRYLPSHHFRGMTRGVGRYVNSQGYVLIRKPDHPRAHKGYVLEHRWIAEQKLGRPLQPDEPVHHLNHVRTDNRPENLVVLSRHEHGSEHGRPPGFTNDQAYRERHSTRMRQWWAERRVSSGRS